MHLESPRSVAPGPSLIIRAVSPRGRRHRFRHCDSSLMHSCRLVLAMFTIAGCSACSAMPHLSVVLHHAHCHTSLPCNQTSPPLLQHPLPASCCARDAGNKQLSTPLHTGLPHHCLLWLGAAARCWRCSVVTRCSIACASAGVACCAACSAL